MEIPEPELAYNPSMVSNRFSRRFFFQGALMAGALPAGGYSSTPSLTKAGYKSPSETLNIASIGAGGRAADDINGTMPENLPPTPAGSTQIVALCDPDSNSAAANFKRYDKAPKYTDFRKMLDKEASHIDAVIIAIPDFMHGTAAMWSMERGKHVYVEKPLCKTIWEARLLKDAAVKYGVATQMGNQHVSQETCRQFCEVVWSGAIGDVTEVHAWTNRPIWPQAEMVDGKMVIRQARGSNVLLPAMERPPAMPVPSTLDYDAWLGIHEPIPYNSVYLPFNWRGWKDFGTGPVGDELIHLLGAPALALSLLHPLSVECVKQECKNPYSYGRNVQTKWEFGARGNMPPLTLHYYDTSTGAQYRPPNLPEDQPVIPARADMFPMPVTLDDTGRLAAGYPPRAGRGGGGGGGGGRVGGGAAGGGGGAGRANVGGALAGAAGAAGAAAGRGRGGLGGGGQNQGVVLVGTKGYLAAGGEGTEGGVGFLPATHNRDYELPPQSMWRSPGHYVEWVLACKGQLPRTMSDFAFASPLAQTVLLSVVANEFEGKLQYDAEKSVFTNNKDANKYLQPPHIRKGWEYGKV
jgi:uncharacterized membrane protein YgcG